MKVCILSIGSELLEGSVTDTNSAFISNVLARYDSSPDMIRMVKDNKEEIINLFKTLSKEFDVIITTGGLGPTFDDITAECVAIACQKELVLNEKAYNHIKKYLEKADIKIHDGHKQQAMLPQNSILYDNNKGTALGFNNHLNRADIICMPGVPVEMKNMFLEEVIPYLTEKYSLKELIYKDLHFLSIAESDIDVSLRNTQVDSSNTQCIINAGSGKVIVKLRGYDKNEINRISNQLILDFKKHYLGDNYSDETVLLLDKLKENKKTLSLAESCTGGLLSEYITNISGASQVFYGSVVCYNNSIKQNVLQVPAEILENYGAVSEECATYMVKGVKNLMQTDYAISITGIAGPTGDTSNKPIGLVYIGIANNKNTYIYKNIFNGDRQQIRMRSAKKSIYYLLNILEEAN